ncbi:acyl-CoA dehydrogenase [Nocardia sp. NEAU-351]|uniref:Acyl-CoA dehydrogenase n=2 Tax=Nocardia bovistercoris TaxID=2785916 RepID=A0A931IHZ7_9NOCA|nr:acyl-CoA dehydrogenase family protein [Nocardia bovistercoris]MBH0780721.1 acyl-CoA dehydrogenase [Nocardia bovistercoris]
MRKTLNSATGAELDAALRGLGWPDLLDDLPEHAVPLLFRLLGETGAHACVLLDVLDHADGGAGSAPRALPFAGGKWVLWERDGTAGGSVDEELPLRETSTGTALSAPALAQGRRALAWWLLGTGRTMLTLAREHVTQRSQFGRPLSSFQAVRHRLAETFVALDGAEAALRHTEGELGALLGKAAAGQAALTAARHCQQVLGGIGFTAEHDLQRHVRRTLVLDGLLGSARELTREAGAFVRANGAAPRLANL